MTRHYYLFNFQQALEAVKARQDNEEKKARLEKALEGIGKDLVVENMPFYKNYLSCFNVERALDGCKLAAEDGFSRVTHDDLLMLFRFVAASFSSSYDFVYDEESDSVDVQITVVSGDTSLTKTVSELFSFQIVRLYEIYLNEQMELFAVQQEEEEDGEIAGQEQKTKLLLFEKKMRQLRDQMGGKEIKTDLEELLNA